MTRRSVLVVMAVGLAGCATQPGEASLQDSFVAQIEMTPGVSSVTRDGALLTFSGPDGRGGTAEWEVRIVSATLQDRPDDRVPYEGHVVSSWERDGELIEPLGTMSGLPEPFLAGGIAQECYALWDAEANAWDW